MRMSELLARDAERLRLGIMTVSSSMMGNPRKTLEMIEKLDILQMWID
jgi:hypothetical protein